jgi:hypothetical protein
MWREHVFGHFEFIQNAAPVLKLSEPSRGGHAG